MTVRERLVNGAASFGIAVGEREVENFSTYSNFLIEYNEKVNLTRITDPLEIAEKHFVDSIAPLSMVQLPVGATIVDVGTGAGFPGVPLKIVRPDLQLTLLDSLQKRLDFLRELSLMLGQENRFVHTRAEIGGIDPKLRERFDVATSRAVARLSVLCEYCLPYVKVGGMLVALKGPDLAEEYADARHAIEVLGGGEPTLTEYALPGGDGRTLVVIPKIAPTPKKYPRQRVKLNEKPL